MTCVPAATDAVAAQARAVCEPRGPSVNQTARLSLDTIKIEAGDDITAIVNAFGAQLPNPANPLSLLARFGVRESDRETVKSAFAHTRSQTLTEPGCEIFELNEDPQKPGRFLVYERWRSLAGLEAHLRKKHAAELRTLFHGLIIDGPEFQVLLPPE
jgi:quinol monooxygenase YgiN